ncbi:MAG: S-layer homology domain-containing protein [Clostridia bacterium]|nr:S-layer homology domain-containing protein [Clostridia bacterium]
MFKKVVALLLISLLLFVTPVVWAETEITAEADFAWETTLTTITGEVQAAEGTRVHLLVLKPGYSYAELTTAAKLQAALCRTDETLVQEDGSFSFTPFALGTGLELGDCSFRVSAGGAASEGSFYYAPLAKMINIINTFDATQKDGMYDCIVTNHYDAALGLDAQLVSLYKDLSAEEMPYINQALAIEEYNVALTASGEEVNEMLEKISKDFKNQVALGLFNDAQTADDVTAALDLFNEEIYGVDTTFGGVFDTMTETKRTEATESLYQKAADRERFAEISEIPAYLASQAVLTAVNVSGWDTLESVILANNDVLKLDLSAYNQLSAYKKDQVMKALAEAKGIQDAAALQNKLDAAVDAQNRTGGSGGGSAGGRTNAKGNGLLIDYVNVPEATTGDYQVSVVFSDISHVAWAEESILALYNRGIISGKETGKFYPDDAVTRAEFVKMLVVAFGENEQEADISFTDAEKGAWYHSYIAKSVQMGVIHGYENGAFGVHDTITRQDMAAILYRLLISRSTAEKATNTDFKDASLVASYATQAVKTLSAYDVLSGDENGNFRPHDNASRAEAAKVIYAVTSLLS